MSSTQVSAPEARPADADLGISNRLTGVLAIAGAATMIVGAVLWIASGADLDAALAVGTMEEYLTTAAENRLLLVANLTAWILGVTLLGAAGSALSRLCRRRPGVAQIGWMCYLTAVPLAIASFVAMLAVVVQIAPATDPEAVLVAEVVAWFGSRADWIATVLIVGIGPMLISVAGWREWVPNWLGYWAIAACFAGLLTIVAMFTESLTTYGFLIVPVGLSWMIAAGVVALRRGG